VARHTLALERVVVDDEQRELRALLHERARRLRRGFGVHWIRQRRLAVIGSAGTDAQLHAHRRLEHDAELERDAYSLTLHLQSPPLKAAQRLFRRRVRYFIAHQLTPPLGCEKFAAVNEEL
jgi:hypothetical protein